MSNETYASAEMALQEQRSHIHAEQLRLGHEVFVEYFSCVQELSEEERQNRHVQKRMLAPLLIDKINGVDFAMFVAQPENWQRQPEDVYDAFIEWVFRRHAGFTASQQELLKDFANHTRTTFAASSEEFLADYFGRRKQTHAKNNGGIEDTAAETKASEDMEFLLTRFSSALYSHPALIFTPDETDSTRLYMHFNRVTTHPAQGVLRRQLHKLQQSGSLDFFRESFKGGKQSITPLLSEFRHIYGISHLLGDTLHAQKLLALLGIDLENLPEECVYTTWDPNSALRTVLGTQEEYGSLGNISPARGYKAAFMSILMSSAYLKQFIREGIFPLLGTIQMPIETVFPKRTPLYFL